MLTKDISYRSLLKRVMAWGESVLASAYGNVCGTINNTGRDGTLNATVIFKVSYKSFSYVIFSQLAIN